MTARWTYGYDAAGNRTSQVRTGSTGAAAGTITWAYNDANQITSATGQTTTWTYDGAGNQTRNGSTGQTTAYNDRLQAITIAGTNQAYIGEGNTDRRSSGSVAFQNGALGTMQRTGQSYTRGPDGSAIGYKASANHYYVTDHLGSVVGMFSSSGAYEGGYSYSPYGEARSTSTNAAITANNLRYTGQHLDANGIYKLGARYYDTTQSRFTQPDPSGQETNPYAYVAGNPINRIDPSGLSYWDFYYGAATTIGCTLFSGPGAFACGATALVAPYVLDYAVNTAAPAVGRWYYNGLVTVCGGISSQAGYSGNLCAY